MNNINALFFKALERYKTGDQTYKEWIEKVFIAAHNIARGNISASQVDPAYRELVINLVHLDGDYYSQNITTSINQNVIKHTLQLLQPIKGQANIISNTTTSISKQKDCGCSN
jgi:hypothetical protein